MKKAGIVMEAYETGHEDFLVDIVTDTTHRNPELHIHEAWLYRKGMGAKMYMFGVPVGNSTREDFLELVEDNLRYNPYYKDYDEDVQ